MADPPVFTLSDYNKRAANSRVSGTWLRFYELTLPDPDPPERWVTLLDPKAEGAPSLPNKILFNGVEWTFGQITQTAERESAGGARNEITIGIAEDATHRGARLLRKHRGFKRAPFKIYLHLYDRLDFPEESRLADFEVLSSSIQQGPDVLSLKIGEFNNYRTKYPKLTYDRSKCHNDWPLRYTHADRPLCNYPSNDFGDQRTEQLLAGAFQAGLDQQRFHGWRTQQALSARAFAIADGKLSVQIGSFVFIFGQVARWDWNGEHRFGPYYYRILDGDFDVHTDISSFVTTRPKSYAGLLIQDRANASNFLEDGVLASPTSTWLFFGRSTRVGVEAAPYDILTRSTSLSVSTDERLSGSFGNQYRIKRVGNVFECYERSTTADSWRLQTTKSLPQLESRVRIGVVVGSDDVGPGAGGNVDADFEHIRFDSGGLATCNRLLNDPDGCSGRDNKVQHNGFPQMPRRPTKIG